MKFNLICDESSTGERHLIVGALALPRTNNESLVAELIGLKQSQGLRLQGEFKWGKVSTSYFSRYQLLLEWFFKHLKSNHFRFRAHVVNVSSNAYRQYGEGDTERAFYKVYHHLLLKTIRTLAVEEEVGDVLVLLDDKRNHHPFQLQRLKRTLNTWLKLNLGRRRLISNVEARQSSGPNAEPFIQIVDVLIGAIGYVRNEHILKPDASPAKIEMVKMLETLAGSGFAFDTVAKASFNLMTFDVKVAMEQRQRHQQKRTAPAPSSLQSAPFGEPPHKRRVSDTGSDS
jgi:hypothetical protein